MAEVPVTGIPAYVTQITAARVPGERGVIMWEVSARTAQNVETARAKTYETALARAISCLAARRA